jgi:hypothetical protein
LSLRVFVRRFSGIQDKMQLLVLAVNQILASEVNTSGTRQIRKDQTRRLHS